MASNTEILIKRSLLTSKPTSLLQGELGFSYASNTLFIGTPGGDDAFEVGGYRDYSANFINGVGQYGNTTTIPVITVASNGQITAINTAVISTTLGINADLGGPSTVDLLTQQLDVAGGAGLTSTVSGQTITIDVDDTVVRSNTNMTFQTIDGDIQISGNLTVLGNTTQIEVQSLNIADPLIYLASNNYTSDVVDIGFVGNYFDGSAQRHAGVFRHAGDKQFYIFDNYDQEPSANTIDPTDPSFRFATLNANLTSYVANVSTLLNVTGRAEITGTLKAGLTANTQTNIVYYDSVTKELTYGDSAVLTPHQIANGSYAMTISGTDGLVVAPAKILAAQSVGTTNGGFSFSGTEGGNDTGMFSQNDGVLDLYTDATIAQRLTNSGIQFYRDLTLNNGSMVRDTSGGAIAFGYNAAANYNQGSHAIAIGAEAGYDNQFISAIAVGEGAGRNNQSFSAVAVGRWAGETSQGWASVAVGRIAGRNNQGGYAVAMGYHAGESSQGTNAVAIGNYAGNNGQTGDSIAIGHYTQQNGSGWGAIAIGRYAGRNGQDSQAIAVGNNAGNNNQGYHAVAMGHYAAAVNQGQFAVAIGDQSGGYGQGEGAVALGSFTGNQQGNYSVGIGYQTGAYDGASPLGQYQVAIGYRAAYDHGATNSIVLNASGADFSPSNSGFYVNPVRYEAAQDATDDGIVFFNQTTKEFRYSYALDGGTF